MKDFFSKYDQIQSFLPIWISEEILHGKLRDGGRGGVTMVQNALTG